MMMSCSLKMLIALLSIHFCFANLWITRRRASRRHAHVHVCLPSNLQEAALSYFLELNLIELNAKRNKETKIFPNLLHITFSFQHFSWHLSIWLELPPLLSTRRCLACCCCKLKFSRRKCLHASFSILGYIFKKRRMRQREKKCVVVTLILHACDSISIVLPWQKLKTH